MVSKLMGCDEYRSAGWLLGLLLLLLVAQFGFAEERKSARVTQDLQVLYAFDQQQGGVIPDRAEVGEPLDLVIEKPSAVTWLNNALHVNAATTIISKSPAKKLINAVKKSGSITIEAWIKPHTYDQTGPARIVSLSNDTSHRNFTLGQDGKRFDVRFRTTETSENGLPSTATPADSLQLELTHVVYTRDEDGNAIIYLNGKQQAAQKVAGSLQNWSGDYQLILANEKSGDRAWAGQIHLVAIYSRALSDQEVQQNYAAGSLFVDAYADLLPAALDRQIDFVKDVQPIFRQHCFECHAQGNEEGGLNLGMKARALEGGENGPVVIKGNGVASRLVHMVAALREDTAMPPEKKDRLSEEQVAVLRTWIDQGADWPAGTDVLDPRIEQAREHWAFQPLRAVELPAVNNQTWARTPIDQFILAGLASKQLLPSPHAQSRKLVRRVYFDLIGLPPTPEEVEAFCQAATTDADAALAALVDRLLESQHYGERWGRHWLDVARYADSDGQEADRDRPAAYFFRDFVIRSLNDDMPYDTFIRWQLAGDEFEPTNASAIAATGFLSAGPHTVLDNTFLEEERLRNRYNELDDMVSTIGSGMLGLTIGCARCHDHKYDALASREYYRLLSALHSGDRAEIQLEKDAPILGFRDFGSAPTTTWLFKRGDFYDRNQIVTLGFPAVLLRGKSAEEYWQEARRQPAREDSTLQRQALALWITDVEQGAGGLLARVAVNRIWQHHFGEGLVRTVGDFGMRGDAPTHPELLEWLAHDFVEHGWQLKRMHRMIINSSVYQQDTKWDAGKAKIDPENRLLWRMRPRRIEAEIMRDAMLAVSRSLNVKAYGPAFKPPISAEAMNARNLKSPYPNDAKDSEDTRRRSVYMFQKRVIPYPLFQAFDRPDALQSCSRRENTTVAPQALALLNDEFVRARANEFAQRLLKEDADNLERWIDQAFQIALSRSPSASEKKASLAFVSMQIEGRKSRDPNTAIEQIRQQALADFCQSIFALNEFIYVD